MSYDIDRLVTDYIKSVGIGETGHPFILSPKGLIIGHRDENLLMRDVSDQPWVGKILAENAGAITAIRFLPAFARAATCSTV